MREMRRGIKCREWVFLIIKQYEQKPPRGGKTGRQRTAVQSTLHARHKTTDQHRTADTRRLNRETNEGNEGDTGGANETMIS